MNNFRELKLWQKSINLLIKIYRLIQSFPKEEQYGLVSQMRRFSASISSNIAEGAGRGTPKDFNSFLGIA